MQNSTKIITLSVVTLILGSCSTSVKIAKEDWQARNDVRNCTELAQFNQRTLPTKNTVVASSEVVASTEVMPTITASAFTATAEQVKTADRMAEIVANSEGKTEKQIKKEVKQELKAYKITSKANNSEGKGKDQGIALLLFLPILIGIFGVHRFYLGYTWQGVVQLLTAGCCGIWALIDFIRVLTGDLKPKDGEYSSTI